MTVELMCDSDNGDSDQDSIESLRDMLQSNEFRQAYDLTDVDLPVANNSVVEDYDLTDNDDD